VLGAEGEWNCLNLLGAEGEWNCLDAPGTGAESRGMITICEIRGVITICDGSDDSGARMGWSGVKDVA